MGKTCLAKHLLLIDSVPVRISLCGLFFVHCRAISYCVFLPARAVFACFGVVSVIAEGCEQRIAESLLKIATPKGSAGVKGLTVRAVAESLGGYGRNM